jgi:4a-hydroxytetrahydrobiopterin dehydratase
MAIFIDDMRHIETAIRRRKHSMSKLTQKNCKPCEGGVLPMAQKQVKSMLKEVTDWAVDETGVEKIFRVFKFENYYQTIAFVNAIAWMTHQENHHPNLKVSYNQCVVQYSTHAINGLSQNDFICAAKVNALFSVEGE